jgi:hypothetical protein
METDKIKKILGHVQKHRDAAKPLKAALIQFVMREFPKTSIWAYSDESEMLNFDILNLKAVVKTEISVNLETAETEGKLVAYRSIMGDKMDILEEIGASMNFSADGKPIGMQADFFEHEFSTAIFDAMLKKPLKFEF